MLPDRTPAVGPAASPPPSNNPASFDLVLRLRIEAALASAQIPSRRSPDAVWLFGKEFEVAIGAQRLSPDAICLRLHSPISQPGAQEIRPLLNGRASAAGLFIAGDESSSPALGFGREIELPDDFRADTLLGEIAQFTKDVSAALTGLADDALCPETPTVAR